MTALRLAVVGCGAAAAILHLPQLARRTDAAVVALVDPDEERAASLAAQYGVARTETGHEALLDGSVDAAIVAVPNDRHADVSIDLLRGGVHVLVEKPMAPTVEACERMIDAADATGSVLTVGLLLRFSDANRLVSRILGGDLLGRVSSFTVRSGVDFSWPITSGSLFTRDTAGGGVLMDVGAHVLDLVLWWFGEIGSLAYADDDYGGVEADCRVELETATGVQGSIELSRTRDLGHTATIEAERATLEVVLDENRARLRVGGAGEIDGIAGVDGSAARAQGINDLLAAEHDDFVAAATAQRPPAVSPRDAVKSIALIEACYRQRRPLVLPWMNP